MLKRTRERVAAGACAALLAGWAAAQDVPPCPPPPEGCRADLWQRAWELHHRAIVVDGHVDTASLVHDRGFDMGQRAGTGQFDLVRAREGGLDAVFHAIYVDPRYAGDESRLFAVARGGAARPAGTDTPNGSARRALSVLDALLRTAERCADRMVVCTSVAELRAAVAAGKHAALLGVEGGHAIEGDLALLRCFHQLGVRYLTLTHENHNEFADSCAPAAPRWGGLNRLGVKVVREMNRLGMLVDLSHVSDAAFADALRASRAPVICSHSAVRALCGQPRNVDDGMLRALAANGGLVMVNFFCGYLDDGYAAAAARRTAGWRAAEQAARERFPAGSSDLAQALAGLEARFPRVEPVPVQRLALHVRHAIEVAGEDHVGIGSDFDGISCAPRGLEDAAHLPRLTYELLAVGLGEDALRKVLGGNLLRVLAAVEQRAFALRAEAPLRNGPDDAERPAR